MEKQKLQKEIENARAHLANMEKMLTECEHERWKPEENETYYFVNSWCEVDETWRSGINFIPDKKRYNAYNCFKTKEQARQESEKILVRRKLEDIARRLNGDVVIDWFNGGQLKYHILLCAGSIKQECSCINKIQGTIYCLNKCFIDVAIKEISEERLKKYLRG